jgi:hypothetical protein
VGVQRADYLWRGESRTPAAAPPVCGVGIRRREHRVDDHRHGAIPNWNGRQNRRGYASPLAKDIRGIRVVAVVRAATSHQVRRDAAHRSGGL